jgi:hypothetical protein
MKQTVRQPVFTADEGVSLFLQKQGLEMSAAAIKARQVFGVSMCDITAGMHNLYRYYNGNISMADLYCAAARRALMNVKIDLVSYDSLISLIQEIKGFGLNPDELKVLQNVAAENRSLAGHMPNKRTE